MITGRGQGETVYLGERTIDPASVMGRWTSSPPSDHLVAGFMLPSVVGALSATSCHQNGIGEPI